MKNSYTTIDSNEQPDPVSPNKWKTAGAFALAIFPGSLVGLPVRMNKKLCNKLTGSTPESISTIFITGAISTAAIGITTAAITSIAGVVGGGVVIVAAGIGTLAAGLSDGNNMTSRKAICLASIGAGAGAVGLAIGTIGASLAVSMTLGGAASLGAVYLVNSAVSSVYLVNERFKKTRYNLEIGSGGKTRLHYAIIEENTEALKLFLKNPQANSMMGLYDDNDNTVCMLAEAVGNKEIIDILADYNEKSKSVMENAIDNAAQEVLQTQNGLPKTSLKIISCFAMGGGNGRGSR